MGRLFGLGIVGSPALISLHAVPNAGLPHVILKDAGPEVDVVLDLEEVDALAIRGPSPGGQVDLHDADGIASRDGKGVRTALDDDDARDQSGIEVVFFRAGN